MVARACLCIGTGLGFKGGLLDDDLKAHLAQHVVEYMIVLITQPTRLDL